MNQESMKEGKVKRSPLRVPNAVSRAGAIVSPPRDDYTFVFC